MNQNDSKDVAATSYTDTSIVLSKVDWGWLGLLGVCCMKCSCHIWAVVCAHLFALNSKNIVISTKYNYIHMYLHISMYIYICICPYAMTLKTQLTVPNGVRNRKRAAAATNKQQYSAIADRKQPNDIYI